MDSHSDYSSVESYSDCGESLTSSILGWFCEICHVRAVKQTELEMQYFNREITVLSDLDNEQWIRCDECNNSYHMTCWETYSPALPTDRDRFTCCKYACIYVYMYVRNSIVCSVFVAF